MKNGKSNFGFSYAYIHYKIWQILKRFAGTFCRAQTLNLGGVCLCAFPVSVGRGQSINPYNKTFSN